MILGGFGGVRQFSFMGVDLGHCVNGFRWFWGNQAIFIYAGLIWGTVLHPLWGVNSPWRMFPNDFYLSSVRTGPLKSN